MNLRSLPLLRRSPPIILVTTHTWTGLQYFAHHLSRYLAAEGFQVVFVEKSPQRWPQYGLRDFVRWMRVGEDSLSASQSYPKCIRVITPRWITPARWLRSINKWLIQRDFEKISDLVNMGSGPIFIYIPPTYNTLSFLERLNPSAVAYINHFNYNADNVMKDLLRSEIELLQYCDALFGLTGFSANRLQMLDSSRKVYQCPPGVDYAAFHQAFRGDEGIACKSAYYFGGIGPHLDFVIYDALANAGMHVVMDGVVDPAIRGKLNPKFEIRPPSPHHHLPNLLTDADCLVIAYKNTPYMQGVFPAKFFECLATGKPVLVSGLTEVTPYAEVVYDVKGSPQKALDVIEHLFETETPRLLKKRDEIAQAADWPKRFETFFLHFNEAWIERRKVA